MTSSEDILWTASELAEVLGAPSCEDRDVFPGALSVSIDSRFVSKSWLFFAIKGHNNDGHNFVDQAFDNGACAAVVGRDFACERGCRFVVDDTYAALVALSKAARARFQGKVIAITGSVGKTTIKNMLAYLLGLQSKCHASPKSFNNQYGVPLTLANMPRDCRFAVIEAGMNNPGELTSLGELIMPDISCISSICEAHIGRFDSLMNIAQAKSELFKHFNGPGTALLPGDNPFFKFLADTAKASGIRDVFSFGEADYADSRLIGVKTEKDSLSVNASVFGRKVEYRLDTLGEHWIHNSLAVLAMVHLAGGDVEKAASDFFGFKPTVGRGAKYKIKTSKGAEFLLIDESYNANPESMAAALRSLGGTSSGQGRRIAVIADMKELGEQDVALHLRLLPVIDKYRIDKVFTCGELMHNLHKLVPTDKRGEWFPSCEQMTAEFSFEGYIKDEDIVMVKGSNSMGGGKIVEQLLSLQV
ncbi:MAG: UDP-N-acetylmuramoyl-tripeptide--D-alanyl-D-alanine ligase [Holosporales bacterium]|jgi:UDP-N-acetylmuramoyl-tripeptide--D-alanyl-D-alanine ligase|nr:UDP-N-acetylmuramoyl-tripeptide--D-alanyl-D-alanine ligase [Holosporales bacterium]